MNQSALNLPRLVLQDIWHHKWVVLLSIVVMINAVAVVYTSHVSRKLTSQWDQLLQQQHSVDILRDMITQGSSNKNISSMPRFLQHASEGGIKPHNALCCLLLDDFQAGTNNHKESLPIVERMGHCMHY